MQYILQLKNTVDGEEEANRIFEELGLTKDSELYGRDDEMEKLSELLDFDKDTRTSGTC